MAQAALTIFLNGTPRALETGASVAQLIAQLELTPEGVAVEVNQELVPRRGWEQRLLIEGDRVELVTLVGGG